MTLIQETTEGERLARVEATVEVLVRDVSDLRAMMRTYFHWVLGILLGIFLPMMIGLIASLIILLLRL